MAWQWKTDEYLSHLIEYVLEQRSHGDWLLYRHMMADTIQKIFSSNDRELGEITLFFFLQPISLDVNRKDSQVWLANKNEYFAGKSYYTPFFWEW